MDFGVVLQTDPPARRVVDLATRAETLGFTYGWTFDSTCCGRSRTSSTRQILAATDNG